MNLAGQTVFITGGGGGIGGGIAEACVENDARVVLADVDGDFAEAKATAPGSAAMAESTDVGPGTDAAMVEALTARMMDPVWLGPAVVRAIEDNQPCIITRPGYETGISATR